MPTKNSVTRTIRFCKEDVHTIETYMQTHGVSFNKAVHSLISDKSMLPYNQMNLMEFIDMSGDGEPDNGIKRNEFDAIRNKLPKLLGNKCAYCGSTENIEYHHVRPLSKGGTNELENIIPLCKIHHSIVHHKSYDEEKEKLKEENKLLKKKIEALKKAIVVLGEE